MRKLLLIPTLVLAFASSATAHTPYLEKADFSFDSPFIIAPAADYGPPSVMRSQAVFAYLEENGMDVYQFTLSQNDFYQPVLDDNNNPVIGGNGQMVTEFVPVHISASALPPACMQYKNFYPVTALIGPGLPAPGSVGDSLPFTLPDGYGALVAANPAVKDREILTEAGLSWFLPQGLTQDCLYNAPMSCDYSNTIFQTVTIPGDYFIVIYNTTDRPGDYTANIGFLEGYNETLPEHEAALDLVRSGKWYKVACISPTDPGGGNCPRDK